MADQEPRILSVGYSLDRQRQGVIATASGGVWVGGGSDTGCLSGFPKAKFCPFCGARVIVTPPNEHQTGWSWRAEARQ